MLIDAGSCAVVGSISDEAFAEELKTLGWSAEEIATFISDMNSGVFEREIEERFRPSDLPHGSS